MDPKPFTPYLAKRAQKARLLRQDPLLAAREDPRNAVRLRQQRRVDDRECDGWQRPRNKAADERRLRQNRERHRVTGGNPTENDVGKFARRRLHDRRGVVVEEGDDRKESREDPRRGKGQGSNGRW